MIDLRGLFRASAAEGWRSVQRIGDKPVLPCRPARLRARFLLSMLVIGYGLLGYRLYTLQIRDHEKWRAAAARQHTRLRAVQPERGRILLRDADRKVPAAVSIERGSLLVYGRKDRDVPATLAKLDVALGGLDADERARFSKSLAAGRAFYARRRQLSRSDMDLIRAQNRKRKTRIAHSELEVVSVRAYPYRGLGAQLLGLVRDGQNKKGETLPFLGNTGLERRFQPWLVGVPGTREIKLDMLGRELVSDDAIRQPAQPGYDLELSIDRSIQAALEDELARLGEEHKPEGASAVVVDPRNGDILAMGSWPTFDPSELGKDFLSGAANRAIMHSYEPGSTIKPLLIGTAWENGLGAWDRPIFCPRRLKVPRRRKAIVDSHTVGQKFEIDVLVESSNTGSYLITSRMSSEQIRRCFEGFGLGHKTGIDLDGDLAGNVRALRKLDPTTLGSVAQGYAVTVTPLQMALVYGALANGGTLYRPRLVVSMRDRSGKLVKTWEPQARSRPLSSGVAAGPLREAMVRVVNSKRGTAKRAHSDTYTIAGKTGTTKKLVNGRYHEREVVASFCGFAPAENPRVAFCVVAWGPSTKKRRAWGGTVAAPAAGRIAERALRLLRVPPSPPRTK